MIRTIKNRGLSATARMCWNIARYFSLRLLRRPYVKAHLRGFNLWLNMRDPGISRELYVMRERERILRVVLERIIRPGMNILDVGGNLGYYPVMEYVLMKGSGRIYVLEPLPSNFELLKRNVALNHAEEKIQVYKKAAARQSGRLEFFVADASNLGTLHKHRSDTGTAHYLTGESIWVEAVSLSELLRDLPRIDLIRMDPEGAEVGCIDGLIPAIKEGRFSARIITEVHPSAYGPTNDMQATLKALFAQGYGPEYVTSMNEPSDYLSARGYVPEIMMRESNRVVRGLYNGVSEAHVLELIMDLCAFRDLVLVKR